jgi:hypothetical protein
MTLSKNSIFELTVHVDKSFGLKINSIVVQKNRISYLNIHVY